MRKEAKKLIRNENEAKKKKKSGTVSEKKLLKQNNLFHVLRAY
jgi:hypothetical protein